jgi:hypothetical protein
LGGLSLASPLDSDAWMRWEDLEAFRLPKNDLDGSLLCFESFGDGGYGGMAVRVGVKGVSEPSPAGERFGE